jgi:HEPN domain-containing protein
MNEAEHIEDVRHWLRYAQEDLTGAESSSARADMAPRHVCRLAQQAAEKSVRGILVYLQVDFPKSHDLQALCRLIPEGWGIRKQDLDLASPSEWAVEARYPGEWPEATSADARQALETARLIWSVVGNELAHRGVALKKTP